MDGFFCLRMRQPMGTRGVASKLKGQLKAPLLSAWEAFNGPFNSDATPLGPIGCRVLIHHKPSTRASWAFRARDGFYVGPALLNYRCLQVVDTLLSLH